MKTSAQYLALSQRYRLAKLSTRDAAARDHGLVLAARLPRPGRTPWRCCWRIHTAAVAGGQVPPAKRDLRHSGGGRYCLRVIASGPERERVMITTDTIDLQSTAAKVPNELRAEDLERVVGGGNKTTHAASSSLFKNCCNGAHFKTVTL